MNEQTEIQGFHVPAQGTYVLLDDAISAIRAYAQSLEDPDAGALIHDLATWLDAGRAPEVEEPVEEIAEPPYGAEEDDVVHGVARVEVYPILTSQGQKWYARSIDTGGYILKVTDGSYDQAFVIRNAEERFPGLTIHLLESAGEDSLWMENTPSKMGTKTVENSKGSFPSLGPPPRRLWAGVGR